MASPAEPDLRKQRGAWYTPPELVEIVVDNVLAGFRMARPGAVRVLDPACGDGRFLTALADRLLAAGHTVDLTGCDVDAAAIATINDPRIRTIHDDALGRRWDSEPFDIVIGNPPFLSQMATTTTRGGASRHGGGPYADTAAEFLALGVELARADGGFVGLVLPQSILASRDAEPVRHRIGEATELAFSWWAPRQRHFDANVNVCAVGLRRRTRGRPARIDWTGIVTGPLGIPSLDADVLAARGTLGERADLNANFRDEYYALVPAVGDHVTGPPLVTSGLIDPGVCHWGRRPVTFAKQRFEAPRVDVTKLTGRFPAWAERKLVPKVLVANQTRVVEAVADPSGSWLPGVPVTAVTPTDEATVEELAAVLTSPVASVVAWQQSAGTGLSATSVRIGPTTLAATPWPTGSLHEAVRHLAAGDIEHCGRSVCEAFAIPAPERETLLNWWSEQLPAAVAAP